MKDYIYFSITFSVMVPVEQAYTEILELHLFTFYKCEFYENEKCLNCLYSRSDF